MIEAKKIGILFSGGTETGINLFPKLSPDVKNHAINLPVPRGSHSKETYTSGTLTQTSTTSSQTQEHSDSFIDKLKRKIHNFNKGY